MAGVTSAAGPAAAGPAAAAPVADRDGTPPAVKQPIIVIDNYDSFTYNLCQVYMVSHVPGPFAFRLLLVCLCMPYLCRRRGVSTWVDPKVSVFIQFFFTCFPFSY